jgi:hypothetical protein
MSAMSNSVAHFAIRRPSDCDNLPLRQEENVKELDSSQTTAARLEGKRRHDREQSRLQLCRGFADWDAWRAAAS